MTRKIKERLPKHSNSLSGGTTGVPTRMAITQYQSQLRQCLFRVSGQSRRPPSAPGGAPLLGTFCRQWPHPRRESLNITHNEALVHETSAIEWGHGT